MAGAEKGEGGGSLFLMPLCLVRSRQAVAWISGQRKHIQEVCSKDRLPEK